MNRGWKIALMVLVYITWAVMAGTMIDSMWEDAIAPLVLLQIFIILFVYMVARSTPIEAAPKHNVEVEKPKRGNITDPDTKIRLLLEMMDDDERYAFKQAMKERILSGSRDGELNYDADSLGLLLDDEKPVKRSRR